MTREFDRNMLIMLAAIMVGVIVITYFVADIQRQSQITTLKVEHKTEIRDISSRNENFTNNFLQGSVKMDAAREVREVGNYHFDFALFWYNTALKNFTNSSIQRCTENCTTAAASYLASYENFNISKPYFETAATFTDKDRYLEVLGYYVAFAKLGMNITTLRYNASLYLKYAAENITNENATIWIELFNETEELYEEQAGAYDEQGDQIDEYLFFDEIRENEIGS